MKTKFLPLACFLTGLFTLVTPARGQSTVFTYQGRLTENGSPASGLYDFEFRLYDAGAGGTPIGSPITVNDAGATNGLFVVALDFGAAFNGSARFLDIAVRPGASSGTYTNLVPRQPITSAPYAVRALQAASVPAGAITSGMLAPGAVNQLGSPDGSPLVALQVNTNGLVGLGTATPASALHIASAQSMLNYELASVRVDDSAGYTNLGGAFGVAVQGNLLAVAAYSDSGVTLMDVTDPAGPILRSQIRDGDGAFTNLSGATGVAMKPNLLAVAASSESAVTLINVTDPVNPVKLSELRDGVGGYNELDQVDVVAISGNLMAVAGSVVTLVDIANPSAPVKRAEIKQGVGGFDRLSSIESIALAGNLLAIGSSSPDRAVTLVDVSVPASPVKLAEIVNGEAGYDSLGRITGLALSGGLLAIASQTAEAVTLVDVTNPVSPVRRAVLKDAVGADALSGAYAVTMSGNQLAVGSRHAVSIYSVADPLSPVLLGVARNGVGDFNHLTDPWSVTFAGSNVVAASLSSGAVNLIAPRSRLSSLVTTGWVGIGTTKPAAALHVMGDVRVEQANRVELNTTHLEAGTDAAAVGFGSTALGYQATALGNYSMALGYQVNALGESSVALGRGASASGESAVALGDRVHAYGPRSTALGSFTFAGGEGSTSLGTSTTASGRFATALGYGTVAIGDYSTTLGDGTIAEGVGSMALGKSSYAQHDQTFIWSDGSGSDPFFTSATSNQFLIQAAGGVGINTNNPNGAALAVNGNVAVHGTITGNGLGLTSLNAASLTGAVPATSLTSVPAANLTGSVPSATLTSVPAANLTGSVPAATLTAVPAVSLTGTINDARLSTNVALRAGNNTFTGHQTIGGNMTVAGNVAVGIGAEATGTPATAIGNSTLASGNYSTALGYDTTASGGISTALGYQAHAAHLGSFVWADAAGVPFTSTTNNQFLIRAAGGVGIGTPNPQGSLHVYSDNNPTVMRVQSAGAPGFGRLEFVSNPQGDFNEWRPGYIQSTDNGNFAGGLSFVVNGTGAGSKFGNVEVMRIVNGRVGIGTNNPQSALHVVGTVTATAFNPPSDRNLKENFTPVSPREVLEKVSAMAISRWNFKGDAATPHVGPMAQDFHAAFGLGTDDKHIATVDADGVALAAIQGLNQKVEEKDAEIRNLRLRLEKLEQFLGREMDATERK